LKENIGPGIRINFIVKMQKNIIANRCCKCPMKKDTDMNLIYRLVYCAVFRVVKTVTPSSLSADTLSVVNLYIGTTSYSNGELMLNVIAVTANEA
jgi:hypothetical protein